MEKQLTDGFKQQLLARRAELQAQISALRGGNVGRVEASAAHFGDREPDSRAQTETERELEFTLDARESAELDAVDAALQRIASGTYGVCIDCGGGIAAPRLHAAPETLRCVGCQAQFEQHPRT
jgi:DnaK suppressor protein